MMRNYPTFYITKKGERAAREGHPWVYGEEVTRSEGSYENGDLVDVRSPERQIYRYRFCQRSQ